MIKNFLLSAGGVFAALSVFAYDANNWQPVDGDWNGKYSDVRHWSRGHLPDGEDAIFRNTSGKEIVVELDVRVGENGVPVPSFFKVNYSNADVKGGLSPVRFVGNGYMTQSAGASMYMYANTHLILDDEVTFEWARGMNVGDVYTNRTIEVRGNATLDLGNNSLGCRVIRISGGQATFAPAFDPSAPDKSELSVTGGTLTIPNNLEWTAVEGVKYDLSGTGKIVHQNGLMKNPKILPKENAELVCNLKAQDVVVFDSTITNELSGTLVVTNYGDGAYVKLNGDNSCLYGGGTVTAGRFYFDKHLGTIDLGRINLGTSYYPVTAGVYEFVRDFTWGAFGNFKYDAVSNSRYLNKLTFDTADCFDPTQSHDVRTAGIDVVPGMSVAVTGGGSASLHFAALHSRGLYMRSLDVADGTTMTINEASPTVDRGRVRFGEVTLGANSTLTCCATKQSFEAVKVTADPSAKIIASVKNLTASEGQGTGGDKMLYSIFSAPLGSGVSAENVTLTDNTGTWKVKQVGPVVYLRDETAPTKVDEPYVWTGAAMDGDWSNPQNWSNGTKAPGASDTVYFTICDTTNIVTIPAGGVTVKAFKGGGLCSLNGANFWARSSEPYIICGGKLTITSASTGNYNGSFYDAGRLPKIFECEVEGTGANMGVLPYAYVMFKGKFTAKKIGFAGAVCFGGEANVAELLPHATYVGSADASVVVAPGGNLTVTSQSTAIGTLFDLAVMGGARATIGGSSYAFTTNVPHVVDGSLAVNAPLTLGFADSAAIFTGTGRVDIAAFAPAADLIGRMELRNSIRVNFASCNTVSAANPSGAMAIDVKHFQHPTIGAKGDWTYGPAAGVTPTTAADDRALRLGFKSELTIDTSDPDDASVSHTVTFADPIVGDGNLTVKGGGKLVLSAVGNRVDTLTLEDDVQLAVEGDCSTWTDVLTAKAVVGLDQHAAPNFGFRMVENADGTITLQAKERTGLLLLIR